VELRTTQLFLDALLSIGAKHVVECLFEITLCELYSFVSMRTARPSTELIGRRVCWTTVGGSCLFFWPTRHVETFSFIFFARTGDYTALLASAPDLLARADLTRPEHVEDYMHHWLLLLDLSSVSISSGPEVFPSSLTFVYPVRPSNFLRASEKSKPASHGELWLPATQTCFSNLLLIMKAIMSLNLFSNALYFATWPSLPITVGFIVRLLV
jgi:hypothetical protein